MDAGEPEEEPAGDRAAVIEFARKQFTSGHRIDMQALAAELGIGRTTLYRWVGDRDAVITSVLAVIASRTSARCYAAAGGYGMERIVAAMRDFMMRVARSQPMRQFLADEPQAALRILMSPRSPVVQALAANLRAFISAEQQAGAQVAAPDPDDVAWIVLQLALSFCWGNVVAGEEPDIDKATSAIRVVLG